jgi:hypothetical protein
MPTRSPEEHVAKPFMNLDEVHFDDVEENGFYTSSRGQISDHISAPSTAITAKRKCS